MLSFIGYTIPNLLKSKNQVTLPCYRYEPSSHSQPKLPNMPCFLTHPGVVPAITEVCKKSRKKLTQEMNYARRWNTMNIHELCTARPSILQYLLQRGAHSRENFTDFIAGQSRQIAGHVCKIKVFEQSTVPVLVECTLHPVLIRTVHQSTCLNHKCSCELPKRAT